MGHVTITAAPPTEFDLTNTLLTPLRKPAWQTYLYFLLISVLAIVGVVFLFCVGLASGLLRRRRSSGLPAGCRRWWPP
jgi:hypothetical protein